MQGIKIDIRIDIHHMYYTWFKNKNENMYLISIYLYTNLIYLRQKIESKSY